MFRIAAWLSALSARNLSCIRTGICRGHPFSRNAVPRLVELLHWWLLIDSPVIQLFVQALMEFLCASGTGPGDQRQDRRDLRLDFHGGYSSDTSSTRAVVVPGPAWNPSVVERSCSHWEFIQSNWQEQDMTKTANFIRPYLGATKIISVIVVPYA